MEVYTLEGYAICHDTFDHVFITFFMHLIYKVLRALEILVEFTLQVTVQTTCLVDLMLVGVHIRRITLVVIQVAAAATLAAVVLVRITKMWHHRRLV